MAPSRSGTLRSKSSSVRNRPHLHPTTHGRQLVDELIGFNYEQALAAKKPIAITVPPPRAPPTETHPALRERPDTNLEDDKKRDSGLAPTTSSKAREGSVNTVNTVEENVLGIPINFNSTSPVVKMSLPAEEPFSAPITPVTSRETKSPASSNFWRRARSVKSVRSPTTTATSPGSKSAEEFSLITTAIPTESLLEEGFLNQLSFSKRGSVMLGGKKAVDGHLRPNVGRRLDAPQICSRNTTNMMLRQPSFSMLATPTVKVLPDDVEKESQKVRSMYEKPTNFDWKQGASAPNSPTSTSAPADKEDGDKQENATPARYVPTERKSSMY